MENKNGLPRITGWFPGLQQILSSPRANYPKDLTAGVVVALVLIPSAIAYADLAKCPAITGLYAALGGMVVFALFTSTRHVIVGPDAAIALLVGAAVALPGEEDPGKSLALAAWLAAITGILLIAGAWFRLGAAADFVSSPVMVGFMNGAAVVIVISQLGKLNRLHLEEENSLLRLYEWFVNLPETHMASLALGLACIALLVVLPRFFPRFPATIMVFVGALIASRFIDFTSLNMQVIGTLDSAVPSLAPPSLTLGDLAKLVPAAVGLAMLVFPEGIILGRAMASRHNYQVNPDRELVALGAANLMAGFLHSFAVGASQTRTLLNDATGGRSQMVSLAAAVCLGLFLYLFADWLAAFPTVAIAGILIHTGFSMVDVAQVRKLAAMRRFDALVAMITSAAVIAIGVLPGVILGVFLSLLKVVSQIVRPHDALLGRIPKSETLHDIGDDEAVQSIPGLVVYRFYGPLIFANVRFFIERLEHFLGREKDPVRQVILDARAIPEMDVTAAQELKKFIEKLERQGIGFVVAKAHWPLRQAAVALGLSKWFSETAHVEQLAEAVAAFERKANLTPFVPS